MTRKKTIRNSLQVEQSEMAAVGEAYTARVLGQPGIVFISSGKASAMRTRDLGESSPEAAVGKWPFSRMSLGLRRC